MVIVAQEQNCDWFFFVCVAMIPFRSPVCEEFFNSFSNLNMYLFCYFSCNSMDIHHILGINLRNIDLFNLVK